MCKFNFNPHDDSIADYLPFRTAGRPCLRWDDHIHQYCWKRWPHLYHVHWFDILKDVNFKDYEDDYVLFMSGSDQ